MLSYYHSLIANYSQSAHSILLPICLLSNVFFTKVNDQCPLLFLAGKMQLYIHLLLSLFYNMAAGMPQAATPTPAAQNGSNPYAPPFQLSHLANPRTQPTYLSHPAPLAQHPHLLCPTTHNPHRHLIPPESRPRARNTHPYRPHARHRCHPRPRPPSLAPLRKRWCGNSGGVSLQYRHDHVWGACGHVSRHRGGCAVALLVEL